jgi:nucleotide-binding universal stress UspA family protein
MVGAIIGAGASIVGGLLGSSAAKKAARRARREAKRLQKKLDTLEANRQEVINPYESFENLTSTMSNPFASLSVATQAAEMQIEEADISLANTLDTLRATGASAGGATALAQAALRSKKGVSASIEQQEAQNEKLKAQGEQQLQQQKVAEERRMQQAGAAGKQFVFGATEQREQQQLDRTAAMLGQQQAAAAQAQADQTSAITGMFGTVAQAGLSGGFDKLF